MKGAKRIRDHIAALRSAIYPPDEDAPGDPSDG